MVLRWGFPYGKIHDDREANFQQISFICINKGNNHKRLPIDRNSKRIIATLAVTYFQKFANVRSFKDKLVLTTLGILLLERVVTDYLPILRRRERRRIEMIFDQWK